jgi:hypothetical protein
MIEKFTNFKEFKEHQWINLSKSDIEEILVGTGINILEFESDVWVPSLGIFHKLQLSDWIGLEENEYKRIKNILKNKNWELEDLDDNIIELNYINELDSNLFIRWVGSLNKEDAQWIINYFKDMFNGLTQDYDGIFKDKEGNLYFQIFKFRVILDPDLREKIDFIRKKFNFIGSYSPKVFFIVCYNEFFNTELNFDDFSF